MRPFRVLTLLLLLSAPPLTAQQEPALPEAPVRYETDLPSADFHRGRREALLGMLPPGAVAVVEGGAEPGGSVSDLQPFAQDPYLYYLTGTHEPGSALLLAPGGVDVDGRRVREILFVPPRDPARETWLGRRFGTERAEAELGVELALENDHLEEIVAGLSSGGGGPVLSLADPALKNALDVLRTTKTEEELRLLRRAIDITVEAHRAVLEAVEPGWAEYEIEALIEYVFARSGAERPGFPSIVGSGENAVILHYDTNRRTTEPGDLVVIDIGASYHGYTADVTRTIPVDGRFTEEQRRIYELVLRAQEAALAAVRPGASFGAPGQAAGQVLAKGLAELGLIRDARDIGGLSRFFPHGTSHYIGLEVHDVGTHGPLEPGQVITVEPGLYIPPAEDLDPKWWNIGVRIEDDVLVTEDGHEVLSAEAPKSVEEIEGAMQGAAAGG